MKTIFVNGTFDILHPGHIRLLNYAKSLGDELIVAIDTDRRVKEKKGSDRPINNVDTRIEMLMSLRAVDVVFVFDTDDQLKDIVKYNDVYAIVKGTDHLGHEVEGSQYAKKIIWFDRIEEYSTTQTIQNIINRR